MSAKLQFVKLVNQATNPVYGSAFAAGMDLCSAENCIVPAKDKCLVSTGLAVAIPTGHYGRVAPRSGLASKNSIDVGAGVIDEDYRGELKVLLFNFGEVDFKIHVGDRIAQLICERISRPALQQVQCLDNTMRGSEGFGSTGINGIQQKAIKD